MTIFRQIFYCIFIASCSTPEPASLKSNVAAKASRLDREFKIIQRGVNLPQQIKEEDAVARYSLTAKGYPPEYLLVIDPSKVEEDIEIQFKEITGEIASVPKYHKYIDQLLNAHRLLLRGNIFDAKQILDELKREYSVTYGYLVLQGTVYLIEGDAKTASNYFKRAQALNPGSQALSSLLQPGSGGG